MADHAITAATPNGGPYPDENGLVSEDVTVVGTGGTTGTYTTQYVKTPVRVEGPFDYSFSGQVVTLGSAAFTGTRAATILGYV